MKNLSVSKVRLMYANSSTWELLRKLILWWENRTTKDFPIFK